MTKKGIVSLFIALPLLAVYQAAWPIVEDFGGSLSADWTLYGNAKHDTANGWIRLTSDSPYEAGSVFYNQPFDIGTLKAQFDIYMGDHDGADGIVFELVMEPGLGEGGGHMGFWHLNGYGVEFDSYDGHDDLPGPDSENHVGISSSGSFGDEAIWINSDILEMENDTWFHVEILFESGHLRMWMSNDDIGYPRTQVIDHTIDGWTDYEAYLGLTAATGGANNRHAVDNFAITACEPCALAWAGRDRWVRPGGTVTLDGSGSAAGIRLLFIRAALHSVLILPYYIITTPRSRIFCECEFAPTPPSLPNIPKTASVPATPKNKLRNR
jgi:hypothetical protein